MKPSNLTQESTDQPLDPEIASLSNLETEAMSIIWDLHGPASAMDVMERSIYKNRARGEEPISFPALQSTLRRLVDKGLLAVVPDSDRPVRYISRIDREAMAARILDNVTRKLLGSSLYSLLPKLILVKGSLSPLATAPDDLQTKELVTALARAAITDIMD